MPNLDDLQQAAAATRDMRDAARVTLRARTLRLHVVEQELARVRRDVPPQHEGNDPAVGLERERRELQSAIDAAKQDLARGREDTARIIGSAFTLDPTGLVAQLDDAVPFVLLPVRIETKFASDQQGHSLLVRIFPDDIAIAHHEKTLTVAEQAAGQTYWKTNARANAAATPEERERLRTGAWNLLASRYGAYRAGWITRETQPAGWSDDEKDPDALVFPLIETKPLTWTDTPRSPVMPDQFAIVLERAGTSRTVFGAWIPDDLALGPDPLQAEGFLTRDKVTGRLLISDDLRWLIDFNLAVSVGMAVRIPITPQEHAEGFDRVLALGLRLSTDRQASTTLLAQLFESHRYSQGLSIVPQGAPTNNTDAAASGLTTARESIEETYALEQDTKPFPVSAEPMQQTDGQRLADALGLPIAAIRAIPNARRLDVAQSVAMNRALWGATMGNFVKEMLDGTFAASDIERVRLFMTELVHGRGPLPAIRVGSQPYGLLVTSSFDDWAWSDLERSIDGDFWDRLQTQFGLLRTHWRGAATAHVRYVGNRDAKGQPLDPFDTLINIVGLQASSVEYWSRTGVPDSYLKALAAYTGNDPDLVNDWIANAKNNRILELTNAHMRLSKTAKINGVLFLDKPDRVTFPVIDGDPVVPLSETREIRAFDGALGHNYIDWLASASSADLQNQHFAGADGKAVAAPTALLYQMLRVATLAELYTASRFLTERIRPELLVGAPAVGDLPNVAAPVLMPAHFTQIDTAKLGVTAESTTAGDYLLAKARLPIEIIEMPPEAAPLARLTDALAMLARVPTAGLERLFAEHLDTVSYRLDAWLTGMLARRLTIQRERLSRRQAATDTYLGAYGWVLDVRASTDRQAVPADVIPAELQPAIDGPVVSFTNNGGFVQAPSLPHAVTAAVLRNAYLTHAEPTRKDHMAVNLSSSRVRMALEYVEGLQNGQELGALLGYQLERGLHEGHPGVELDQYIYVLRARFPLLSNKLTPTPDGVPAEVVEARNVINGYDLLDVVKDQAYPYSLTGLPSATSGAIDSTAAMAIAQEIDRLRDAMDAVGDLLLAESVHQVVQGNYARARGAVQAMTDGEAPTLPEVIQSPRSGKSLTHRVALFLDVAAVTGWQAALTPRAAANAALNHWLATILPAAADVQWMVTNGVAAPEFVDLTSLDLEPIDIVLMSGDRVGDLSSALEQLQVYDFRRTRGVKDDVATCFFEKSEPSIPDAQALVFDPDRAQPGKRALGSLLPLLKALRRIICGVRPLGARDLMRATEAQQAHPDNPQGHNGIAPPLKDLIELRGRVEAAHAALAAERLALQTLMAAMKPLSDALEADPTLAVQAAWPALLTQVQARLRTLVTYGIPEAMPQTGLDVSRFLVLGTFAQAVALESALAGKLAQARAKLDLTFTDPLPATPDAAALETGRRLSARVDAIGDAARLLLGSEYVIVPLFGAHAERIAELDAATATPIEPDPLAIESWLQSLARVRPQMQAWDTIATYHDWLRSSILPATPMQLPVAAGARWIGGIYSDTVKADDVASIVLLGVAPDWHAPVSGLLVDEWIELVPGLNETTGLAMHINRPNAVAPQAILVAVAPKRTGHWDWPDLVAILHDTLDRARLRAVEPDHIGYPYFQLLPPIVTAFNNTFLMATAKFATAAASAIAVKP
jgi:hypothetical protein